MDGSPPTNPTNPSLPPWVPTPAPPESRRSPVVRAILQRLREDMAPSARAEVFFQAALAVECSDGDAHDALHLYLQALRLRPKHTPTQESVMRLGTLPGLRREMIEDGDLGLFEGSQRTALQTARAERRLERGEGGAARSDLDAVLARAQGHRPARLLLQQLAAREQDHLALAENLRILGLTTLDEDLRAFCYYTAGKLAEDVASDPGEALANFRFALEVAPDSINLYLAAARCARRLNDHGALGALLEREAALNKAPGTALAAAIEAALNHLIHLDQPAKAVETLRKALEVREGDQGRSLDAMIARDLLAAAAAEVSPAEELKALRELGQRLTRGRRQAAVFTRIAQLMLEDDGLGDIEGEMALRYLESALDADATYRPALLLLDELYAEGRFPGKGRELLRRRGLEQSRPDVLVQAAMLTVDGLKRPDEAVALLRQAISLSDDVGLFGPDSPLQALLSLLDAHPELHHLRAQAVQDALAVARSEYARRRLLDLAITFADDTSGFEPTELLGIAFSQHLQLTDPHLSEKLAGVLARQGRWDALVQLRRNDLDALEDQGTGSVLDAMIEIALTHELARHDRESAISWYRAVLDRDASLRSAQASLEQLLIATDRWDELTLFYHGKFEQAEDEAERASLAYRLAMIAEYDPEAVELAGRYYRQVLAINPSHLPSILGALRNAEQRGDLHEVAELTLAWAEREPDDHLASALHAEVAELLEERLGDVGGAAHAWRAALERMPRAEVARTGLIRALARLGLLDEASEVAAYLPGLEEADPDESLQLAAGLMVLSPQPEVWADDVLQRAPGHWPARLLALRLALSHQDHHRAADHAGYLGANLPPGPLQAAFARLAALVARLAGHELDYSTAQRLLEHPHLDEQALLRTEAWLRDQGDLEGLATVMRRRADVATDDLVRAASLLTWGRCLQTRGHHDAAIEVYEQILEERPGFLPAVKALKLLQELVGDREGFALSCEREGALVRDPQLAVTDFLTAGEIRRRVLGDIDGAIVDLETVMKLQPTHDIAFESLKEIYSLRGQARDLYVLMQRRAEAMTDPAVCKDLLLRMAEIAFSRLQDNELARRCHQQVLQLDPLHIQSYRILAELYEGERQWQQAVDCLVGVLGLTEDRNLLALTYKKIADIYDVEIKDASRAIEAYRSLIRHDPNRVDAMRRLAVLLHQEQRWEEAAKAYGNLLQRERSRTRLKEDLRALSLICLQGLHDPARAEQCLVHALRLDATDLALHAHLIAFYRERGELEKIEEHLLQTSRQFAALLVEELAANNAEKVGLALAGMTQLAEWDEARDRAFLVAAAATYLDAASEGQAQLYGTYREAGALRLPARPIPIDLTDVTIPHELSASLLNVLRYADEAFRRVLPPPPREWNLGRRTRLSERDPRPGAEVLLRWPSLFALQDVQIHLVPGAEGPELPMAIPGEQPLLVLREDALPRLADADSNLLFALGRAIAPLSMGVGGWIALHEDLYVAALVAAIRPFNATWLLGDDRAQHPHVDEDRVRKIVQRLPERLLIPHVFDITARLDVHGIQRQRTLLDRAFGRLALIPVFNPAPVLHSLRRANADAAADALGFVLNERLGELRRAVGVALD